MTTRRSAIRRMTLFAIGMALGKLDTLSAAGGQLTCDLSQWSHVVFKLNGKTVTVPVSEVFSVIVEGHDAASRNGEGRASVATQQSPAGGQGRGVPSTGTEKSVSDRTKIEGSEVARAQSRGQGKP